jgi:hypothetical protein
MGMNPTWAVYLIVSRCSVIWCSVTIGCAGYAIGCISSRL